MATGTDRLIHVGLDVHRDTISAGVLRPGDDSPDVERFAHDEASIRRFIGRFADPTKVRSCYEAGPTGYGLVRLLESMSVRCSVIAPSMIPVAPGDKVKTDRRDCKRLARLLRAGELTAIRVPTAGEEAVRDLCRARFALVSDRRRARQRLGGFLLRHDRIYRAGTTWTTKHREWLEGLRFDDGALQDTFDRYLAVVSVREAEVIAIGAELDTYMDHPLFADAVSRLSAYRGVHRLGALHLASEVCDWRRFASAGQVGSFCGLVPSEYSSGDRTRRGHLTRAGNVHVRTQLIESAWAYRHRARLSKDLERRHQGLDPAVVARAWKAQLRLCRRFAQLSIRKDSRNIVCAAVARELAGFLWAEMTINP